MVSDDQALVGRRGATAAWLGVGLHTTGGPSAELLLPLMLPRIGMLAAGSIEPAADIPTERGGVHRGWSLPATHGRGAPSTEG